jgi:hypothetical protein
MSQSLTITHDDLTGLPEELVNQLNVKKSERKYADVLNVIRQLGGMACLDKILIGLYKETNVIYKRTDLTALLYRMCNKKIISSVKGKKGIYMLPNG